jgi:poly(glycerol-phosphate) alpha-glucosyltransferase
MKAVSLVGSVSRLAGGLFESVRRLHQELVRPGKGRLRVAQESNSDEEENSISVSVLGTRDEFTGADIEAWRPVDLTAMQVCRPRAFGYSPQLYESLLALDPDVVHVHGLWQYSSVAALCWHSRTARPYMVSPHGMLDSWALAHSKWKKRFCWAAYERRHLEAAACIRALCKGELAAIRKAGLATPVCLIPNGVDVPELGSVEESEPELNCFCDRLAGRKVLLYLGRIHPKKGLTNLVKAWAKIGRPEEWLLVIAGWDQGGHEAQLKVLADEHCGGWEFEQGNFNGTSVVFAGPQYGAAKRHWLRRCQAAILPSYSEGLPMAVLEAWSFGKPVLATPWCNVPEGFTVGAAIKIGCSVEEVSDGLNVLFGVRESELAEMGARGRELVAGRFAWKNVTRDLRRVYQWMVGEGEKPECVECIEN